MDKRAYTFACIIVTSIAAILTGASDFFNWPVPVNETISIVEGAIIGILGAWSTKLISKKSN